MDSQFALASRDDVCRLQIELKNMYATQAEHADRLANLEQRQDGDTRVKQAWGTGAQSPFSGIFNGTSQPDQNFNPAAEAFKHFDQDQSASLMGSLHLDAEEEPRRGASRANSVRFDERALQGPFAHNSRTSSDFLPMRTSSAFGSHPLTERSSSHKSDGRQSSAGQSVHSARAGSFGLESRPLSATVPPFVPLGPPPGLFILGPVPSIIRCWLNDHFSNDSLLYAAVCTASYKSILTLALVSRLGFEDRITYNKEGLKAIKLPVYLPEATIQQSSSRSNSPTHQLPTITTEFIVQDLDNRQDTMQVFLGCDVLRARNADIHFSLDRLTLFDDERNKLSVPLVRPENAKIYQKMQTFPNESAFFDKSLDAETKIVGSNDKALAADGDVESDSDNIDDQQTGSQTSSSATPAISSPSVIGEGRRSGGQRPAGDSTPSVSKSKSEAKDSDTLRNGSTPDTSSRTDGNSVWGSWRREAGQGGRLDGPNASGYQRAGRGRGMKVLKPARLNTSRTSSTQQPGSAVQSSPADKVENQPPTSDRRTFSSENKPPFVTSASKPRSANPVGGASAFGWLNPGSSKPSGD